MRACDHCEICGTALTHERQTDPDFGTMHHRYPRRQGGTDTVSGLLQLCVRCHSGLHQNEVEAVRNGWLCLERSTCLSPVRTHQGWVWLREDGSKESLTSVQNEELNATRGPVPNLLQPLMV